MIKTLVRSEALGDAWYAFLYFSRRYPVPSALVFVFTLLTSAVELVSMSLVLPIFALATQHTNDNPMLAKVIASFSYLGVPPTFGVLFSILIMTMIAKSMILLFTGLYVDNSVVGMADDLRARAIKAVGNVSWSYLTHRPHGLIVNLMSKEIVDAVGLFGSLQTALVTAFLLATYMGLGLSVSPMAFIAAGVLGILGALASRPFLKMARLSGKGQTVHMRELVGEMSQGIQAFKAFKAMAREQKMLARLNSSSNAFTREAQANTRATRLMEASQHIILALGLAGIVSVGHGLFGVSLAEIGFVVVVILRLHQNLLQLLQSMQKISNRKYVLVKVEEMVGQLEAHREVNKGKLDVDYPASIRFESISFTYDRKQILCDVDLTISTSGMTTVIGASGAGKTTLVDILCGFLRPSAGRVIIGDQELAEIDLSLWRKRIGYVTQEPNLLNDTIRANVAAFDETMPEDRIVEALRAAGAWGFVSGLPEGLNTKIGVSGGRISGGERQRVAIARALAQQPQLLVLDEPTAALDPATEQSLIETFLELKRKIVIIAISHQPAMAAAADAVYELNNGQLQPTDAVLMDPQSAAVHDLKETRGR
jgi:ATP-binding cassette subfamily C protein